MKMKGKHLLKKGIALLLVVCMFGTYAPEMIMAEDNNSNDTYLTATPIYANSPVIATTSKTDKVDFYKYTVTEPGYFTVSFNATGATGKWQMEIYDSKNLSLAKSGYAAQSYESSIYNLSAGQSIYILMKNYTAGEYVLSVNSTAASDWEQEPNDDRMNATLLQNGEWINGSSYKKYDEDWYKYTVSGIGYVRFEMQQVDEGSKYWVVEVEDDGQHRLEKATVHDGFQSMKYCDEIGKSFYIHIKSSNLRQYQVRAVFTESDDWETELNNTVVGATPIKANETIHGVLNTDKDIDLYKFVSPGTGVYYFNIGGVDKASKAQWKLSVYDANNKLIQTGRTKNELDLNMTRLNFKKGSTVYLKVEDYSRTEGSEYAVTLNYEKNSAWEQESNDSFKTANTLKKGKVITGTSYSDSDTDYYVYKATKKGTIKFTFSGDQVDYGNGWNITVYDQNKKVVKSVSRVKDTQTIGVKAMKGKKYYCVVKPYNSRMVDVSYTVIVK